MKFNAKQLFAGLGLGLVAVLAIVGTALPAHAQTRLSLDAGILMPVSDMADVHDLSPVVGARWGYQDKSALGHVATRTWFLRFAYGIMQKSDLPALDPEASDGHYFDATIGGRAYAQSRFSPFFMSVSGGYAQYKLPGDSDTFHGGTFNGGLGLRIPFLGFILEGEARGHITLLNDIDNVQFFTGIVSLGIPL